MKKYKLKTHKATKKRFKLTGSGKVVRKDLQSRNNAHLKNKSRAARKKMPKSFVISAKGEVKRIKKLLNK
jgi:large subunit ribosomal protein L35